MTFKELQVDLLNLFGGDSGGDEETMAKAAINRVYRRLLDAVDADHERREFTLTTAASTSKYGMPLYVKTVLNMDDGTNDRRIFNISALEYDVTYPGTVESGTPTRAYRYGVLGVQKQISTAEAVTLQSSSASDTGINFQCRVTGFNSADVLISEKIQLTGTTPATSTATFKADGLERVVKLAASGSSWSGYITLKGATSGTTFATIPVWWDSPDYQWIEFHPIPDAALTYTVRAIMRKPELVDDEDWPEINEDFHNLLVWGAAAEMLPLVGKTSISDRFRRDFENGLARFSSGQQVEPNRVRVFADVSTQIQRSARPLIKGVDFA